MSIAVSVLRSWSWSTWNNDSMQDFYPYAEFRSYPVKIDRRENGPK